MNRNIGNQEKESKNIESRSKPGKNLKMKKEINKQKNK